MEEALSAGFDLRSAVVTNIQSSPTAQVPSCPQREIKETVPKFPATEAAGEVW